MMHCHGELNLIPSKNGKSMKIINLYNIRYRGHNCALLTFQRCWEPLLRQRVRLGPVKATVCNNQEMPFQKEIPTTKTKVGKKLN